MTTLAADREHLRMAHRARRIEQVIVALRELRGERAAGAVPPALDHAITEFSRQLTAAASACADDDLRHRTPR